MLDETGLPPISRKIWNDKYRLKTIEGHPVDDTVQDTWRRVANALAEAEPEADRAKWADAYFSVMDTGEFSPAGRIIAGAGSGRNVTLSNCFTMGTIPDSMDGIFTHLREAALTMQAGGGIGYDFSTLRPKGATVKGVGADASGPLTFMDVWDAMCRTVMSAGSRRGAMMATMRCDHPDIEAFIDAKKDPARLRMFNLSVLVTDEFMAAVRSDKAWELRHEAPPRDAKSKPVNGRWPYRSVRARDLWDRIMRSTYAQAEPGVIFIDRVNQDHNIGYLETICTTNPCGEKPMGPYASCLLGSINLAMLVAEAFTSNARIDEARLHHVVGVAIRAMDSVPDVGRFPLPQQETRAQQDRQLGLGVTGLADALVMLGLRYGSDGAVGFTERVMKQIALAAYQTSIDLAKEKGPFETLDADKFLAAHTFAGRKLPRKMQAEIRKTGIRNALLVSIAPTGTISLFARNVSSGIEPIFAFEFTRKVLQPDGSKTEERVTDYAVGVYESRFGKNEPKPDTFVTVADLTPEDHVRMQAAAQRWVDSSISKTVNLPEDISFDDFKAVYELAYDMGCKGCTTYRPNEVTGSVLVLDKPVEKPVSPLADLVLVDVMRAVTHWLKSGKRPEREARIEKTKALLDALGLAQVRDATTQEQLRQIAALPGPITGITGLLGEKPDLPDDAPYEDPESLGISEDLMGVLMGESEGQHGKPVVFRTTRKDIQGLEGEARHEQLRHPEPEPTEPADRPKELEGRTYKLKFGADDHAVYVTINDVIEAGVRRPFEVFINSKNMEHYAWTVGLTRMISAVFRRPHDSRFVAEELKAVFDPKGGAWMDGRYVPSILAAIGGVIEQHMKSIGYMTESGGLGTRRPVAVPPVMTAPYGQPSAAPVTAKSTPPKLCAKCSSDNIKTENGCPTCLDCGHSKCG